MHRPQWQIGFAVLLLLAGALLVIQVRANQALRAAAALPTRRLEDLTVLIRRQQETDRVLRDEVAALRVKLDGYRAAEARGRSLTLEMQRELSELRGALGLTPVHGPGLVTTLEAAPGKPAAPQAQDVAGVVNELWAAGAEAVAVNGVRVLATGGFSPQGDRIRAGAQTLLEPYAIVAIGDPSSLEEALLVRGGIVDGLRGVGITVTMFHRSDVALPAYTGPVGFRFARPAPAR